VEGPDDHFSNNVQDVGSHECHVNTFSCHWRVLRVSLGKLHDSDEHSDGEDKSDENESPGHSLKSVIFKTVITNLGPLVLALLPSVFEVFEVWILGLFLLLSVNFNYGGISVI